MRPLINSSLPMTYARIVPRENACNLLPAMHVPKDVLYPSCQQPGTPYAFPGEMQSYGGFATWCTPNAKQASAVVAKA